jgi:hypothetical protein
MGPCRAISLAGIFVMLADPAQAQEAPGEQGALGALDSPGEREAEPGAPGDRGVVPGAPGDRGVGPGEAVSEDEQLVLDDVTDTKGRPWADGVPLDKRKRAYELFLEGNSVIKDGFFAHAADKYREALVLWDHPAFHYNLGIAQMNLDQPIDAYERFLAARKHGARPITDEKYRQAKKYLDALRKQLGEIEVICDEPGAEVAVDGTPLFAGPGRQRVMVRPGGHRVEASKRRFMPDIQQVVVNPGDSKRVTVTPQIPEHLATVRRWPEWIPLTVAGAGAVALAGAGVMDWHSTRLFDRFDSEFDMLCRMSSGCRDDQISAALQARLDQARLWQWGARATYVVGGLSVATSAALLYLNRERIVRERRLDDAGTISLSPMVTPDGVGVSAYLRFQ